ncbi:MAG: DPP IV N-terminal domain-containing protein [Odoribacteraceae bacterium]|jgi:dipeptidyl aminopeptidase/acylaminoacyl peptidase|nr:DPP IV N-terminal domain-containing protein [Odoribacteraceae bacterium]
MKTHVIIIAALLLQGNLQARDLKERYANADAFRQKYTDGYYRGNVAPAWIENTSCFWYSTRTPRGTEFFLVDAKKRDKQPAFDQEALAKVLGKGKKEAIDPYKLPFSSISFSDGIKKIKFTIRDSTFTYDVARQRVTAREGRAERWPRRGNEHWGRVEDEKGYFPVPSPDKKREAFTREGNLYVRDIASGKVKQLSFDGSEGEYYSARVSWSPDSRRIVACKYRPAWTRKLRTVVAAPLDQLQPRLEEIDYVKPGDALPARLPVLFIPDEDKQIPVAFPEPEAQFSLGNIRWHPSSLSFTFDYNKRGHQEFIVYKVSGNDPVARPLLAERSATFVYYNNIYRHDLVDANEHLWISERDGWRHLYLYDDNGNLQRQITRGEWIVKRVLRVDERARDVYFIGCGRDAGEDPYLEKLYRVNIDSGELLCLTPENGNHQVLFSPDNAYFTDSWSRVDLPPVALLRSAADGATLLELERADVSKAIADGWRAPEVFHAKGRDGETDIWGVIVRPVDFDPSRKYPVIEYIYAGPHDSFVPKSFTIAPVDAALAQLGFIVVQIDGMGTANRSKKFHDVCWKNLKDAGFPDRIAWMKAAAAAHPEMDLDRVGIYGCSAGGQSAMGAVLFHPEFYKVSVSACGCHDNRMDKIWWNEQWMGYPVGPEYAECSNVVNAHLLQGKLMLILGELDDNVDPSSTVQVVDALIKANKEFDYVLLPNQRHTMGGQYGERKRRDFFVRHLLGEETPAWNTGR